MVKNTLSIRMYAICVGILLSEENNCSQIWEFILLLVGMNRPHRIGGIAFVVCKMKPIDEKCCLAK